jgi:hypothetical protein
MEIPHHKVANSHTNTLDKCTRTALATYLRQRFPFHTAKMAAREFDLTLDEAKAVAAERATFNTYDKIKKAGGWPVSLAVEASVVGHGLDDFLERLGASHDENGKRLAALWPGDRAVSAHPPAAGSHVHSQDADRSRPSDRRAA